MPATIFPPGVPFSKRVFDLTLSAGSLVVLSPFLGLLALAVWIAHGRPVFFRQVRPGYHGRPFELLKFRSMADTLDESGDLLPDSMRLTRLGRLMRMLSLDELPELINVLRGEMSLVGPRPLLMQYLPRYTPAQARRHEALPGITGWAQINGRNDLSWEDKFRLDVWYVDHRSMGLDLKILGVTLVKVLRREGISQEGYISAAEFRGPSDPDGSDG